MSRLPRIIKLSDFPHVLLTARFEAVFEPTRFVRSISRACVYSHSTPSRNRRRNRRFDFAAVFARLQKLAGARLRRTRRRELTRSDAIARTKVV